MRNTAHFLKIFGAVLLCASLCGCCQHRLPLKQSLLHKYPDRIPNESAITEVSLDLWEKVEQTSYTNQVRLRREIAELDGSDEAKALLSRQLQSLEQGHLRWLSFLSDVRTQTDPEKDVFFYQENGSLLIVRGGHIRKSIPIRLSIK